MNGQTFKCTDTPRQTFKRTACYALTVYNTSCLVTETRVFAVLSYQNQHATVWGKVRLVKRT